MNNEIKGLIKKAAQALKEAGAREVYLFGSVATGTLREDSDIDMAVSGLPPEVFFKAMGLSILDLISRVSGFSAILFVGWNDRVDRRVFLLATFTLLGPFGGNAVLSILHRLTLEFETNIVVMSLAVTLFMVPFAVLQLISGAVSDSWGRRRTLILGEVIFIAGHLIAGLAPSIFFFLASRVVQAVGFAFVHPVAMAIVGDLVPASRRGNAMGWLGSMMTFGIATGPLVGGILAEIDWRLTFFIISLAGTIVLMIFLQTAIGSTSTEKDSPPIGKLLRRAAGSRGVRTVSLSGFFMFLSYAAVLTSLSPYLVGSPFRLSDSQVGFVIASSGIAGILISPLAGRAVDRIGRAWISTFGMAGFAAVFAVLPAAKSYEAMIGLFFVIGAFQAFAWAGLMTLSVEILPGARATSASIFNMARFIGFGIASQVSSLLFLHAGMNAVFLFGTAAAIVGALMAAAVAKPEKSLVK